MKRAALYARVSTEQQATEGDSIPAQISALKKYIADRPDMVLIGEYIDGGVSGTKADREELTRLTSDIEAGLVDIVLVTKLDRLYRSIRHYTRTMETWEKHNVHWLAIWEPIYDTTTPQGRLIVNQMMSLAQYEAENTGQRIRQVVKYKIEKGEAVTGNTPTGYSIIGKKLVPNEDAEKVASIFERYLLTNNLSDVTRYAESIGLVYTKHAIKALLQNRKYAGYHRGNPNYCEPIVSQEIFDAVQIGLSRNIKKNQKQTYLFSGLLVCSVCGSKMGSMKRVRKRGNCISNIAMYRCCKHYVPPKTCTNSKAIYETVLERYLLTNLRNLGEETVAEYQIQQAEAKDNSGRITSLNRRKERLKELFLAEGITLEEYKIEREKIELELETLTKEEKPTKKKDLSALTELLEKNDLEGLYQTFTPEEKRFLWRSVIERIVFEPKDRSFKIEFLQ